MFVMRNYPHKDPGKQDDDELIEKTRRLFALTLRPTTLSSPIYRDDYEIVENGRVIGRIYEDTYAIPQLRWFWSMTAFVGDRPGVTTKGRAPTLELAKARFLKNWRQCRGDSTRLERPFI